MNGAKQRSIGMPRMRRGRLRARQHGASLLEAISYLGIAAIVVIGAVALLSSAFSSASTNSVNEQVSAIQSGVKKLYMGQSASYTGLTNSVLASAGVFPASLTPSSDANATITNTWNGTVTVAAAAAANEFTITYTSVPQSVCVNSVTAGGSWASVSVNGTAYTTMPVTPANASTACSSTDSNTIIWTST
ncbi:MAG TPA: type 4 pilus major pilin [Paraburkholderia sp.]|nr:type 4 pilus major pilin [Paraburkholderia sp.]